MLEDWFVQPRRRARSRVMGSAGGLAFMAGVFLAGKIMIWLGMLSPGQTPNSEILNYWPGFLIGGCVLGIPAAIGARLLYDKFQSD